METSKKAQVTLFVIIAIFLVAAIAIIIYVGKGKILPGQTELPGEVKALESEIVSCIEDSSEKSLLVISSQGGYITPETYFSDGFFHLAYWYDKGDDISPNINKIEYELATSMNLFLPTCIDFKKYTFNITSGDANTTAKIKTDSIIFKVNYPITIVTTDKTYRLKEFSTELKARLGKVYNVARMIVNEQKKNMENVCLTCLADIGAENNVFIDIGSKQEEENMTFIATITDNSSKIYDEPYKFKFAMKI